MFDAFWRNVRAAFGLGPPRAADIVAPREEPAGRGPAEAPVPDVDIDHRLPQSALDRALSIRALSSELEARCRSAGLVGEMADLERLRTSHLPRLLHSYVAIPPEERSEVFRETGRSASFQLNERLDRILERLHQMSRQLARGNVDEFTQNILFVDMRYGAGGPLDPID